MAQTDTFDVPTRLGGIVKQAWRDLLSIYYANTPIWRVLKTGALLFLGFFLWMGGNVLFAYWPDVTALQYVMAYGFVLLLWGPLTHFVVVPTIIRFRRTAEHPAVRTFLSHASKLNFSLFLLVVVVVGTLVPGAMVLEFQSGFVDGDSTVEAEIECETGSDTVSCHLPKSNGVDHVVLLSGGEQLDRADEPPYRVTAQRDALTEGPTGKQYVVELRNADDETLRRFVRTVEA